MSSVVSLTIDTSPRRVSLPLQTSDGRIIQVAINTQPRSVEVRLSGQSGSKGADGPPGPTGPPGAGVLIFSFLNAATWTVSHHLGRHPIVQLIDDTNAAFDGDVEFPDLNTAVVTHANPRSGSVLVA